MYSLAKSALNESDLFEYETKKLKKKLSISFKSNSLIHINYPMSKNCMFDKMSN